MPEFREVPRMEAAVTVNVVHAIRHLARAAASSELTDGKIGAEVHWYIVRSMCHEHGVEYDVIRDSARRYAAQVAANNVNII